MFFELRVHKQPEFFAPGCELIVFAVKPAKNKEVQNVNYSLFINVFVVYQHLLDSFARCCYSRYFFGEFPVVHDIYFLLDTLKVDFLKVWILVTVSHRGKRKPYIIY